MKQLLTITLLLCAALCAPAATLNLTAVSPLVDNGYHVGYDSGNLNGGPLLNLECIAFFNFTTIPSSIAVNVSHYDTVAAPTLYKEIDYLLRTETPSTIALVQWTIWNLVNPLAPDHDGSPALVASVQAMDLSAYIPNIYKYTPLFTADQAFVSIADVPEPATFGRLGVALVALAMFRKRRRSA